MAAISVIIPAYNVEKWIEKSISTLQGQTFKDYDVFIVNDGSTDRTGAIADELALSDSRINVIHQKNAGAAGARNAAIAKAQGKYLYFMDADDWAEPSMLEDMYSFAEEHDLELVVTGFYIDTYYKDDKAYRETRSAPDAVYETQHMFREAAAQLFDAQLLYAPWNKLYKRSYLVDREIFFPDTFWDDLPFNLEVVRDIERVGAMSGRYYHFLRAREESENTRYRPGMYDKREEENAWMHELYEHWGIDTPAVREFLARRYAERLLGCIENVTCRNCDLSGAEKREEIRRMISTPQAIEALALAEPTSAIMACLFAPMRRGSVTMTKLQSSFISFVKRNSTNIFARLKANR